MRIRPVLLTVAVIAVVAIGCSSNDSPGTTTNAGGTTASTAPSGTAPADTAPSGTAPRSSGTSTTPADPEATPVALADSPLGSILVDGQGMTVYVFMKDTATTSACTESCAQAWPAVTGGSVTPGAGLDAGDFTTITSAAGTPQVVFYGHPLYTYAGDNAAGDTLGQGIGGIWFVVDPDGNPVQTTP
jgi:predicted lipoprotein with Yx(FWY)xxD motif